MRKKVGLFFALFASVLMLTVNGKTVLANAEFSDGNEVLEEENQEIATFNDGVTDKNDIEEDEILSEEKIQVSSSAIVSLILAKDVDTLICSNLDIPMMVSLSKNNIEIIGGAQGKVKSVVNSWINGTLECNDIVCSGQESGGCSGDCTHCKSI